MFKRLYNCFDINYKYPVYWTDNLFSEKDNVIIDFISNAELSLVPVPLLIFIDQGFAEKWALISEQLKDFTRRNENLVKLLADPIILPGDEYCKNDFRTVQKLIDLSLEHKLCRHSQIWVFGGGAFLDAIGFAASIFHRGVPLLRFPTTSMGQGDSAVGVKNACNYRGIKNLLGTFAAPAAVFNDGRFLATLDERDWISGIAEAFKVAIIKDKEFLLWLSENAAKLKKRDLKIMSEAMQKSSILHLEHIKNSGDPFERGSARPLDFGHWAAHKLESMSQFALKHGESVSIGMALDIKYAEAVKLISKEEKELCLEAMKKAGLPLTNQLLQKKDPAGKLVILEGIEEFREHLGGKLHITMPKNLGTKIEINELKINILKNIIASC